MRRIGQYYHFIKVFSWRKYCPALFFFCGFAFDALTIGKQVQQSDFVILTAYLLLAAGILWWLAHHSQCASINIADTRFLRILPKTWRAPAPYFVLQFIYGNLLSALFILYFKSSSHLLALFWSLALAGFLIANEYLEDHYQASIISWTMFGFCAILLLNFLLPCLVGSIHWFWFVLSTLAGAGLTHLFYKKSGQPMAHILPTWVLAGLLLFAYFSDVIPPVPLVKQDAAIGVGLTKTNTYNLQVDSHAWWQVWRAFSDDIHIKTGERVYCITAVFAPRGLHTRLYHRWQFYNGKSWVTTSRIGFVLNGGRQAGFRGYTYKQNVQAGAWRVTVETEDARTLSTDSFSIVIDGSEMIRKTRAI